MKKQSNPCEFSEEELLLACYGDLDNVRKQQLLEHLQACNSCRQQFIQFDNVLGQLHPATLNYSPAELQEFSTRLTTRINRNSFLRVRVAVAALAVAVITFFVPWQSDYFLNEQGSLPSPSIGELSMVEVLDFYQNLELLELLDLFVELEPLR